MKGRRCGSKDFLFYKITFVDRLTKEQRRKNMQAVKSAGTDIEKILSRELWARGYRYRKNCKSVFGKPDIVIRKYKLAIFCDSEFWHGYDWQHKKREIKSHRRFWIAKIERNIQRDKEVTEHLQTEGWTVLRFWGNEIKHNVSGCVDLIEKLCGGGR